MCAIAAALEESPGSSVSVLDLENKGLSAAGCAALSRLLQSENCAVTSLKLAKNGLKDADVCALLGGEGANVWGFGFCLFSLSFILPH